MASGNPHSEMSAYIKAVDDASKVVLHLVEGVSQVAVVTGGGIELPNSYLQDTEKLYYKDFLPLTPFENAADDGPFISAMLVEGEYIYTLNSIDRAKYSCTLQEAALPIRILRQSGVETLIILNTCKGLDPIYKPGDLCLITDHINLLGSSPLIGLNVDDWGPRFPDMTEPYDPELRSQFLDLARTFGVDVHQCVFAGGEVQHVNDDATRYLKRLGATIYGTGFVNEVIVARHMEMRVLGLCCVVNEATGNNMPDQFWSLFSTILSNLKPNY